MRRVLCTAALGGVLALALPVPAAHACSVPIPRIDVDRERVAAGGTVRVSGQETTDDDGKVWTCVTPTVPVVTPSATVMPSESPSPTTTAGPLPTGLPTTLPSAAPAAEPATAPVATPSVTTAPIGGGGRPPSGPVTITIAEAYEWPEPEPKGRVIATVAPNRLDFLDWNIWRHSFAATVTIPAGLAPGEYDLAAYEKNRIFFGTARITVLPRLPDTGAPAASLAGIAVLSIVAGGVVLELSRRARTATRL